MADSISGFGSIAAQGLANARAPLAPNDPAAADPKVSFQNVLLKSIEQVNQIDQHAQNSIESGLTNGDLTQAEIFTAMKKTDLAYRTMMQVRNKLLDAYREIQQMRM